MNTLPADIAAHPGFQFILSTDSTGCYSQRQFEVYQGLLSMTQLEQALRTYLDGFATTQDNGLPVLGKVCYSLISPFTIFDTVISDIAPGCL
jgi:hypothetical protein